MRRQHAHPDFHPDDLDLLETRLALNSHLAPIVRQLAPTGVTVQAVPTSLSRLHITSARPSLAHQPQPIHVKAHGHRPGFHAVHHPAVSLRQPTRLQDPSSPPDPLVGNVPSGVQGTTSPDFINCIDMNPDLLDMNGPCSPG